MEAVNMGAKGLQTSVVIIYYPLSLVLALSLFYVSLKRKTFLSSHPASTAAIFKPVSYTKRNILNMKYIF